MVYINLMGRINFYLLVFIAIFAVSCGSGPITVQRQNETRLEVQQFIENLNQIIASSNYNAWREVLSPELFAKYSSEEYLRQRSEQLARAGRGARELRTAEDYFMHVVVPARRNLAYRVDDIEFITLDRVNAFTVTHRDGEEIRLLLFNLERINNSWAIIYGE